MQSNLRHLMASVTYHNVVNYTNMIYYCDAITCPCNCVTVCNLEPAVETYTLLANLAIEVITWQQTKDTAWHCEN